MTPGPWLGPSPASGALPFIFRYPSAAQLSRSRLHAFLYCEHIDSIEGHGGQNGGHAAQSGKVEEIVFGGC